MTVYFSRDPDIRPFTIHYETTFSSQLDQPSLAVKEALQEMVGLLEAWEVTIFPDQPQPLPPQMLLALKEYRGQISS